MHSVSEHGQLRVSGTKLVDKNGSPFVLYGMSTHGINYFPRYVNKETFVELKDAWHTDCIRLALYLENYNGYCICNPYSQLDSEQLFEMIKNAVDWAIELDVYIIVDWHVLSDKNPLKFMPQAAEFFKRITALYGGCPNVLYEICNEPNDCPWEDVKKYAEEIIPIIRKNSPDSVIIVGTPEWCQRLDLAAENPLNFGNILYAVHFYAATHTEWLRERTRRCIDGGLPVIVSEFGISTSSGDGEISIEEADKWKELITGYGLSFLCWSLSNHIETSAVIKTDCYKLSGFTDNDLKEQGVWVKKWFEEVK